MLDIQRIRKRPEEVKYALLKRMDHVDFKELLDWDSKRRSHIAELDSLREIRNRTSSLIGRMKQEKEDASVLQKEMKDISDRIKVLDTSLSDLEARIQSFLEMLPNIPDEDVPAGGKECNTVESIWGKRPEFSFKQKDGSVIIPEVLHKWMGKPYLKS